MIQLEVPGPEHRALMVDELQDDRKLWRWGFGKGQVGRLKAMESMRALLESDDPELTLRVALDGPELVGVVGFRYFPVERRAAKLFPYIFRPELGLDVILSATATLFELRKQSLHRVQAEIPTVAKQERLMFKQAGYRQEGKQREALWTGTNVLDTLLFAVTRPEWNRKREAA